MIGPNRMAIGESPVRPPEVSHLRDLSPQQWKSGIAAWLGWLFDGLDMHLYVLVATPFVAELLGQSDKSSDVKYYSSLIQGAFLIGWALGGSFFGRISDRLGRSRALMLTILVYACFTGLSYFAHTWWELLIYRFLAALGVGGEWAVGASLLSETWPSHWRPWLAAVLQTGVNLGVMLASASVFVLSPFAPRTVFLVGVLPAFLVLWIRRAVPEPEEWRAARDTSSEKPPKFVDLFRGSVRRTTILTLLVCGLSLTAHWAFIFWYMQQLRNLPDLEGWSDPQKSRFVGTANTLVMIASIVGNFFAGWLAQRLTYRRAITALCLGYFVAIVATYGVQRGHADRALWIGLGAIGICQGVFALFTMYLPPLFPTLLRSTGAGFCYNFGRVAAGVGTVVFGLSAGVGDSRLAIVYAGALFVPAAAIAWVMPKTSDEESADAPAPVD
ncbi:MAG TPA: MFS transporter [Planctomycetaceae bacterium]|nr:MFS transporter [Planctomycetaceae bacterium]